ncbi:DsbA family protein [Corynebacterium pseudopelargi]|uniref:Disulfide bond formation protein D n=1 Tax=Corynebacterium pseudopelargi TaxID=2080757 RepID=A0A3G6IWG8_9CORY|nr:thioredoxin domain-containing protein [Corynebacterium pseudopelargi]AZA10121.1 Disulfide bond formation protein D precursor [Corynebacterium pseudopelargi]
MTQRSSVSPRLLALVLALVLAVAGGAYFIGARSSNEQSQQTATESAQGEDGQASSDQSLPVLANPNIRQEVTPGTQGLDGPEPLADGSYDASIFGPKAPIKSAEDVRNVHRRNPQDPFAIGAVDAPVVIAEFSDFECPYCSQWSNNTEPALIKEYVDRGLVRIEWNDMPVNGPAAEAAAKAGRAAAAQGKFDAFRRAFYQSTAEISGHPNFTLEDYVRFAKQAGVPNIEQFRQQASDGTYDEVIEQAKRYGASIGIQGTPAFVVGEQYISGAQPLDVFMRAIDQELQKVQQQQ